MGRDESSETAGAGYGGEVWTDARGYATVALPRAAGHLHRNVAYELRPFTNGVTAEIAGRADGRPLHDRHRRAARQGRVARDRHART